MPEHGHAPRHQRTPERRHLCVRSILAALTFFLAFSSSVRAEQVETTPTDKLIELRQTWLTQLARQEAANWELERIGSPRSGPTIANIGDPNAILDEFVPVLNGDYDAIRSALSQLTSKNKSRRDEVQKSWEQACRDRAAFREFVDGQQKGYGFNFDAGTPPGFKPNILDMVLLAWAATVFVIALRLRANEQRLAVRKAQRIAAVAAILVSVTLMPGCGMSSGGIRPWMEREQAALNADIKDATEKADAAVAQANLKWQANIDAWTKLVTAPSASGRASGAIQDGEVGDGGQGLRDRLRAIAQESHLIELIVKDTDDQRNKLAEEHSKLDDLIASAKWRTVAMSSTRTGVALVLFGITIAPYWSARRTRNAGIRLASRTCPRCFRRDTLKVERSGGGGGGRAEASPRYRGRKVKKKVEEPEPEEDEDTEARCTKCGLRMRRSYLKVPRLCFPTVGVRSSGKTHMLVTAYDRIRKRNAPTAAVVQPAPSGGDIDKRFDRLIEEILHRRGEAGATDLVLPDPILVHLKDLDPAGGNSALINLFDYSGELINPDVDVNQLKATAVRMDGFMLFLDPTQLYGDGANVTLDEQLGMLDTFLDHMRRERKIPVGGSIPVPVAVCITKFDLLVSDNPIGGQSVAFIRHILQELNPPPKDMTLEVIQARNDLVEEMLPLMFTGANVREIVEGYFGKQVMFFPMSSVGLFEHELGIKDLSRRNIAPFGVAEPLFWLLHMHGYEVFS